MLSVLVNGAGSHVKAIQQALRRCHQRTAVEVDGEFGPITERQLEIVQTAPGLDGDGMDGPKTREMSEGARAFFETGLRLAQAEDDRVTVSRVLADPDVSDALRAAAEEVVDGTPEEPRHFLETGRYEVDE